MTTTDPARLSNHDIALYAERVGEAHDVHVADAAAEVGKVDVYQLVKDLGGTIQYSDGDESSHVFEPGQFVIFLPHSTSVARDRFTIAHELGHYFLHYRYPGLKKPKKFGRGARNRAETEANVFASALLMPAEAFRNVWNRHAGDLWSVANHFGVSRSAAQVRAEVLSLP